MNNPSIVSIGQACALIQASPDHIRLVADQLGIVVAMRINGVAHYSESDLERIARVIANRPPDVDEIYQRAELRY